MRLAVPERIDLVNQLYHPFERRLLVGCLVSQPHFLYFRREEREIWTDADDSIARLSWLLAGN